MRAGLLQINASDDPAANLPQTLSLMDRAVDQGATFIFTPEVTNLISTSRTHQRSVLCHQADDPTLAALRDRATKHGVWLNIGSLALKTSDPDGRFANRSFLISPAGDIAATYDKIHMFDVAVNAQETYRESAGYRPGDHSALAQTDHGALGLTICYDMRFPNLYRHLAQAGAQLITVPSAFSPVTGVAHWHSLLRARAVETGAFIIAAAQTGDHSISRGKPRSTYGHSLAVNPWGEVILDAGPTPGAHICDINLAEVALAREKIPALSHDRSYKIVAQ